LAVAVAKASAKYSAISQRQARVGASTVRQSVLVSPWPGSLLCRLSGVFNLKPDRPQLPLGRRGDYSFEVFHDDQQHTAHRTP